MALTIGFPIAPVNRHNYYSVAYASGMTRGERFREARGKMSQADLARKIGVSQPTIAAAESGGGTEHIVKIALATGYSPYWLENGRGPKKMGIVERALAELNATEDDQRAAVAFLTALKATRQP
jgi:transcriptional regulator with XRE-family HTH domain